MKRNPTLWTLLLAISLVMAGATFATAQDKKTSEAAAAEEKAAKDVKPPSTPNPTPEPEPEAVAKKQCSSFCAEWCGALEDMSCTDKTYKDDFREGQKSCKKTCPKTCEEGAMPAYLTECAKSGDCKKMSACIAKRSGGEATD